MLGEDRYKIIRGESLAVMREMESASVDAIVSDPPYSSGGFTRGDRMGSTGNKYTNTDTEIERPDFAGDNRDQRGFLMWCTLWMSEALRIAKPGAPIVIFTDWRQLAVTTDAIQCGGWVWRGIVPWDKTEGVRPRMGGFRSQCEYVVWGSAGPLEARRDVGVLPGVVRARSGDAAENIAREVIAEMQLHGEDPLTIEAIVRRTMVALAVADGADIPGIVRCSVKQDDKHHVTGKPTEVMRQLVKIAPPKGLSSTRSRARARRSWPRCKRAGVASASS